VRNADHVKVTRSIEIVLADDHAIVLEGLRLVLDAQPGMRVVAEAHSQADIVPAVVQHRPEVLLLDLNFPDGVSVATLQAVLVVAPATRVLMLTMESDPGFARATMRAGAVGFVLKDSRSRELVRAVRDVAAGRTYVDPEIGARLALEVPDDDSSDDDLSDRERDVLRLIALGHTNREVAERLHLSTRTVDAHRANLQLKLRRSTRAELVRYALDQKLLDL
jgi:two-component system, NarL family, response regulator NreC